MTLRTKTSLLVAILIFGALGISGCFYLRFLEDSLRSSIFAGLESVSITSSEAVSRFLQASLRDTQAVAIALPVDALEQKNAQVIEARLKALRGVFPDFENGMFILDAQGKLWVDTPANLDLRGKSYAYREYFQKTLHEGHGIIGTPYVSTRVKEPVLTFTTLLRGSSNEVIGVLGCSARLLSERTARVIRSTRIGKTGYIYVFDTSRLMILHPQQERVLERDVPVHSNPLFDAAIEQGFEGTGETVNSRGIPMLAAFSRVPGTDWILVAQQSKAEAYAPLLVATDRIVSGMCFFGVVTLLVMALGVRRITSPLVKLRNAVVSFEHKATGQKLESFKESRFGEFQESFGCDEIADLAQAFQRMSSRLEKSLDSLREAAADWANTFNSVPDAIFLLDRDSRIRTLNRAAADLLSLGPEEAVGKFCHELKHGATTPPVWCPDPETRSTRRCTSLVVQEPETGRFFQVLVAPCLNAAGDFIGTVLVITDITQRKRSEKALREAHKRLDSIIEFLPDATFVIDTQGKVITWNRAIEEMTGVAKSDMIQKGDREYAIPIYGERRLMLIDLILASDPDFETSRYEHIQRHEDMLLAESYAPQAHGGKGAHIWSVASVLRDSTGRIVGAIESVRNITDRKRAEEERLRLEQKLQQSRKAESLGRMAGAIAHHFNNLLMAVMGNLDLALHYLPEDEKARANIAKAMTASRRAAEINRFMLIYSGQAAGKKELLDLAETARETLLLVGTSLPHGVRLKTELPLGGPFVLADRVSLRQVLTNLILNSCEAIGEGRGEITVALNAMTAGELEAFRFIPSDWEPKAKTYACLSVSDTGCGLDATAKENIFDPFFSTKFTGRGLGLPVVLGLVKAFDGAIGVESQPGRGATFRVFLPVPASENATGHKPVAIPRTDLPQTRVTPDPAPKQQERDRNNGSRGSGR